ncbi:helix-turn-helix transcriptional regulator [Amycolatopsis vastitatis]|nr:helix-turn-helix transcriptional regulator [Amycolatopsis vastitatis]
MRVTVDRAISVMWERFGDPLTLDDLADAAFVSRFYFSRVFKDATGTSPGRFLSAIRLAEAKNYLLRTSLSAGHISTMVGYNSVGTFTSRFGRSVGMSPARYRYHSESGAPGAFVPAPRSPERRGELRGRLEPVAVVRPYRVYVGLFGTSIAQGLPVSCAVMEGPGDYRLPGVPDGTWFVRAAAVATTDVDPRPWARRPLGVGECGPVLVRGGGCDGECALRIRPMELTDLPILLFLPELDCRDVPCTLRLPVVSG